MNRHIIRRISLAAALMVLPAGSASAESNTDVLTMGVGSLACSIFLGVPYRGLDWMGFATWSDGFLSALNWVENNAFQDSNHMGWITDYCRSHPDSHFAQAATQYAAAVMAEKHAAQISAQPAR